MSLKDADELISPGSTLTAWMSIVHAPDLLVRLAAPPRTRCPVSHGYDSTASRMTSSRRAESNPMLSLTL
jgi:hypothetical protein